MMIVVVVSNDEMQASSLRHAHHSSREDVYD